MDFVQRTATSNRALFVLAIFLVVILPCVKTAIVPFVDLIGLAHINSYPGIRSYGPDHYYVFQLTYILPHILSRILFDSGVPANQQVFYFYALQVLFGAGAVWVVILRFAGNNRWAILLQIWGTLVVYDGLFMWGGPFPWSITAVPIMGMFFLATRKYPYSNSALALIYCGLPIVAMVAHPFALFPLMMVLAVLWLEGVNGKWWPVLSVVTLVVLALLIAKDSPENPTTGMSRIQLALAWFKSPPDVLKRTHEFIYWNHEVAQRMLGGRLELFQFYSVSIALIKLIGIVFSPTLYWLLERPQWKNLRPYLVLNWIVFGYYLIAADYPLSVSLWPHRILVIFTSLQFAVAAVTILHLASAAGKRWRSAIAPASAARFSTPPVVAGFAFLFMVALWGVNSEILRRGEAIASNYTRLLATITALVPRESVITMSGVKFIAPFSLRAVPIMLFDDASLIARKIVTVTEWHPYARHNTRINPYTIAKMPHEYSIRFRAQQKPGRMEYDIVQVR